MAAFVLMGAGEFLPWADGVDRWALDASPIGSDRVLVAPAAAAPEGEDVFDKWARMGFEHYERLGVKPELLDIRTRADAEDPDRATQITGARYLFFSGGNPAVLADTFGGTAAWKAIRDAVGTGMALGGCSAGMVGLGVVVPDTRHFGDGNSHEAWVPGLELFTKAFFGAHWDQLENYMPGLTQITLEAWPSGTVLFAVDEETAACGDGTNWRVEGKGVLTIPGHDGLERVPPGGSAVVDLGLAL